eukprot:Skav202045  [mRNA]  locus=scaffold1138:363163:364701:- [translate_table: standard]
MLQTMASEGHFHRVLGVPVAYADDVLPRFWQKYRVLHPGHDLFNQQNPVDYSRLLPFYLHGDGGRTYKKDNLLVLSIYNALGEGTAKNKVSLQPVGADLAKRRRTDRIDFEPGVNLLGNTLSNRFLFTAIKSAHYKNKLSRLQTLLTAFGTYLADLFQNGFEFNGSVWRVVVLGITGDAPFHREAGNHNRSFSNVSKTEDSKAAREGRGKGCCWLCPAGASGAPIWEDVRVASADWTHCCGRNNPLPWDVPGPLLAFLPTDDADLAGFYKPDIFHIWHAGVGKDFSASALIYLMKTVFKQRNINVSLGLVNDELKTWRQRTKEHLHFGKLTFDLLGYSSSRTYPVGHWSKNMDTASVTRFVQFLCQGGLVTCPGDEILETILDACGVAEHFMHLLFTCSFFLTETEAWQLIQAGQSFLNAYMKLATLSYNRPLCLWKLKPKLHMLAHIVHTALCQFRKGTTCVINPVAESTFMCEDFIGKVSRLSRRVSAKQHGKKILQRYMVAARYHAANP